MNIKKIMLIILALIWFVLLFVIVAIWMKAPRTVVKAAGNVEILVAAKDIGADKPLTDKNTRWQTISEAQLQADDIKRDPQVLESYLGRPVLIAVRADQIIKKNYFAPLQTGNMSELIRPGRYAMTVVLNKNNDENLFIVPGDKVDVFLTNTTANDPNAPKSELVTQLLLTNLRVLAVDTAMVKGSQSAQKPLVSAQKTLTLEVSPRQAERLTLGQAMGTLTFGLRTDAEVATNPTSPAISSKSLAMPSKPPIVEYHGNKVILSEPRPTGSGNAPQ